MLYLQTHKQQKAPYSFEEAEYKGTENLNLQPVDDNVKMGHDRNGKFRTPIVLAGY